MTDFDLNITRSGFDDSNVGAMGFTSGTLCAWLLTKAVDYAVNWAGERITSFTTDFTCHVMFSYCGCPPVDHGTLDVCINSVNSNK